VNEYTSNMKPAAGFTLPCTGVTPAPSNKTKMRDSVPVWRFLSEEGGESVADLLCGYFTTGRMYIS